MTTRSLCENNIITKYVYKAVEHNIWGIIKFKISIKYLETPEIRYIFVNDPFETAGLEALDFWNAF